MEPLSATVDHLDAFMYGAFTCGTFVWNLIVEPVSGTLVWNPSLKPLNGTHPLTQALYRNFIWNHEPFNLYPFM